MLLTVSSMIFVSLYIVIDTYFVADVLGADGLAALNIAIPIFSLVQGTALLIGIGGSSRYSIFKGEGKIEEANRVYTNSLYMAILFSICFFLCGFFGSSFITSVLGTEDSIFELTETYIRWLLLGSPIFIFNTFLIDFIRNDDAPKLTTIAVLVSSLSNIVLDYLFMYIFKMGILGAVLATVLAASFSIMTLLSHIVRKKNGFSLILCQPDFRLAYKIFSLGSAVFLNEVSVAIVMIAFNALLLSMSGKKAVAAYGIVSNISLVFISILNGIGQGAQPLLSSSYGRGDSELVKKYVKLASITAVITGLSLYLILILNRVRAVGLFNGDNDISLGILAVEALVIYFFALAPAAFNIVSINIFISVGKAKEAQVLTFLRGLLLILPLSILLSKLFNIRGLWLSYPLCDLILLVPSAMLIFKMLKKSECV